MSIFRSTFKPYVRNTITNRQNLLNKRDDRPIEFQAYVSSKVPWARMVSFVNYNESVDLAKKYVLYGGTLYQVPNTSGPNNQENPNLTRLRSGIGVRGGSYASDLGNREYGIRPMPGIESITSKSMSAYGSLRETTIKYYAWDLSQLQDLNILYMKPGYPVLVEWGWSLYLDQNSNISNKFTHIDAFKPDLDPKLLYEEIKVKTQQHLGNYDANLGFIKNYSYTLLKNGGFECTTTLISLGDVINSIKMNGGISVPESNSTEGENVNKSNDEFCKLLSEIANESVESFSNYDEVRKSFPVYKTGEQSSEIIYSDLTRVLILGNTGDTKNLPGGDSRYTKFINFGYFIHILNNYTSLFFTKNGVSDNLIEIELPFPSLSDVNIGNGYCVSSVNAASINNDVCFIVNSQCQLLRAENPNDPNLTRSLGFFPKAGYKETPNNTKLLDFYSPYPINLGIIGAIYVNIGYLISVYSQQQIDNQGSSILGATLKKILKDIEYTLGSINDFDLVTIDNKGIIIDKHYVEPISETTKNKKFQISIMGLDTTVREHRVMSKIFEEQSTLVAIAAQNVENVATLQTSTQVALNKNLSNRLYSKVTNRLGDNPEEENKKAIYNNTIKLATFLNKYIITGNRPVYNETTLSALNTFLNQALVVVNGATDYKAIVPITLQLKLDGISGITIGEIFRVKSNVLPLEYDDKSVGFIVTRLSHEIIKSDWVTTIEANFCLLDQEDKYKIIESKNINFLSNFEAAIDTNKINNQLLIHYYNTLLSFVADFFNDDFVVINAENASVLSVNYDEADSYQQRRDKPLVKYYSNYAISYPQVSSNYIDGEVTLLTRAGFTVNPPTLGFEKNIYNRNPRLTKEDFEQTTLSNYLNYADKFPGPTRATGGVGGTVAPNRILETDYISKKEENTVKYLNYIIENSFYYTELEKFPKLKELFKGVYEYTISEYSKKEYSRNKIVVALSAIFGSITPPTDSFAKLWKLINPGVIEYRYLNPNSIDQYGNINSEIAFLKEGVVIDLKNFE
jgi:hypothetical protein